MYSLKVVSLVAALFMPSVPRAEGFVHVPKWTLVELPENVTKACYDFADGQKLAMLDADLQAFSVLKKELPRLQALHHETVVGKDRQITLLEEKSAELESQREALHRALRVSETARIKAETNPTIYLGWIVAGGVGLVAVGLSVALGIVTSAPR